VLNSRSTQRQQKFRNTSNNFAAILLPLCGPAIIPSAKLRKLCQIAIKRADRNRKGILLEPGPAAVVCRDHFSNNHYFHTTAHGKSRLIDRYVDFNMINIFLIVYFFAALGPFRRRILAS
jgi:hypothetical protein